VLSAISSLPNKFPWLLLSLVACFAACTPQIPPPQLSPGLMLRSVGPIDRAGVAAWSPDGARIALASSGTRLRNLATGGEEILAPATPVDICWSADGNKIAAAYAGPTGSHLRLFVPGSPAPVAETSVPGRIQQVFCRDDGQVLAVASVLQTFSFGGNFTTSLHRWDGLTTPTAAVINDVSVKPLTLQTYGSAIFDLVQPQLSPLQDELLFTRLHDPPAFPPYLKLVQYHLATGLSRVVENLPLTSPGGRYLTAGESLAVADGQNSTRQLDPWTNAVTATLPLPGRVPATSLAGGRLLVDGHLYAEGQEVAVLSGVKAAVFAPRGDRVLLRYDKELFLLEGLSAESRPPGLGPPLRQTLLKLRQWRSADLISHDDYLKKRGEMLP